MFEVKLVPVRDPQAEGRWANVAADQMWLGRRVGAEFVVKFNVLQPFYQHGGYPTPEIALAQETKTDG
jgi:hypothetical protein